MEGRTALLRKFLSENVTTEPQIWIGKIIKEDDTIHRLQLHYKYILCND